MIKRIFLLSLLVVLACCMPAFADTARRGSFAAGEGITGIQGLADVSSGVCAEITSAGGVVTTSRSVAIGETFSSNTNADTLIYTGACYVQSITLSALVAGDYANIYDGTDATGTARFDPRIAANTSSFTIDAKGAPFATGIYVDINTVDSFVTVVYDY